MSLGTQVLGILDADERVTDGPIMQKITVESAKANFENAQLTREVAEIAVTEYDVGIYKQDEATVQGELKLAESDLKRKGDMIDDSKARLAKIREVAAKGVVQDLATKYRFEDNVALSVLEEPRARLRSKRSSRS